MLALKVILAGADRVPTLIFDEVDSGIGGKTAVAVGRKLKEASMGRQVLCITHLPQIASFAGEHFVVEKKTDGKKTRVAVYKLDKEDRVREVARMLGDDESSAASAPCGGACKKRRRGCLRLKWTGRGARAAFCVRPCARKAF